MHLKSKELKKKSICLRCEETTKKTKSSSPRRILSILGQNIGLLARKSGKDKRLDIKTSQNNLAKPESEKPKSEKGDKTPTKSSNKTTKAKGTKVEKCQSPIHSSKSGCDSSVRNGNTKSTRESPSRSKSTSQQSQRLSKAETSRTSQGSGVSKSR